MAAKFASGTRVRIRSGELTIQSSYSGIRQYDNVTGEVVASIDVVGYLVRAWDVYSDDVIHVLHAYTVHLDTGIEIDNVVEEYLEALQEPG